jgi:N-methylhydantoinase A
VIRAGIDTGGTFTDIAIYEDGELRVGKVPTTPDDPSRASAEGLAERVDRDAPISILGHGTTIATNALLQHAVPRTALITTLGFRDVVDIGRQKRLGLYDLDPRKPEVPVERDLRFEVTERVNAQGEVLEALDETELGPIGDALEEAVREDGLAAVAIGFLHAYQNPEHELAVERYLRERFGDELVVCRSSAVLPEFREYERLSSTILNAALTPVLAPYVRRLQGRIETEQALDLRNLLITQSDGTLLQAEEIAALPIRSVLSGPASGVVGAMAIMDRLGERNYVTLDMGGTSTDICAVQDGEPLRRADVEIGGFVARTPSLDIHTIGAGGGSIAALDSGGHLKVGPRSAGADPGPASYGKGGREPTVTDATVVLGYLRPESRLAASIELNAEAAAEAIQPLADSLGRSLEEAAAGILAVEVSSIERAVRTLVAGRGIDMRDYALCVFGGAGPVLASEVARALDAREILIPPHPGLLCAVGLLVADLSRVFSETRKLPLDDAGWRGGQEVLDELREQGLEWRRRAGLDDAELTLSESVDMRYGGQNFEITVALPESRPPSVVALREAFEERHEKLYRFTLDRPADFVTWRVTAALSLPSYSVAEPPNPAGEARDAAEGRVFIDGRWRDATIVERGNLPVGARLEGPAVVSQMDSTVLLLPGDEGCVDDLGNLRIERKR